MWMWEWGCRNHFNLGPARLNMTNTHCHEFVTTCQRLFKVNRPWQAYIGRPNQTSIHVANGCVLATNPWVSAHVHTLITFLHHHVTGLSTNANPARQGSPNIVHRSIQSEVNVLPAGLRT